MKILIVEDERAFGRVLSRAVEAEGHVVELVHAAEAALEAMDADPAQAVVTDLRLPGMSGLHLLGELKRRWPGVAVILMTAFAEVDTAREALLRGALDYLVKPFDNEELIGLIEKAASRHVGAQGQAPSSLAGMIGASPAMRAVFDRIRKVADSDAASVLIQGESGTGKELAARAVHSLSARRRGPFVEVQIPAMAESVLENELFGHERGAFTGADEAKAGLLELAAGGTVFFDEIGEMALSVQPKLLRFLQERRFYRVGGTDTVTVDARVVAATNRNLQTEVQAGRFREDLYYRFEVVTIELPPLRQRRQDIAPLIRHFLGQKGFGSDRFDDEAYRLAEACDWPGNVRQLRNVVERALVFAPDGPVGAEIIRESLHHPGGATSNKTAQTPAGFDLESNERQLIEQALLQARGNKTKAAEMLGITRRRLYSRLKSLGLEAS